MAYARGMSVFPLIPIAAISRILLMVLAFFAVIPPVLANNMLVSAWQEKGALRGRLFLSPLPDGRVGAGLELKMAAGWHTYWKNPGASGISPSFDWTGSANFKPLTPLFEAPLRFKDMVGDYFGYQSRTIIALPLKPVRTKNIAELPEAERPPNAKAGELAYSNMPLRRGEQMHVKLKVDLGVCRDICLPVQFNFTLAADMAALAKADPRLALLLRQSFRRHPMPADENLQLASLTYDGVALNMVVTGRDLKNPDVIIAGAPLDMFDRPHILGRDRQAFLLTMPAQAGLDMPFIGRALEIILRDGNRAVRQTMRVAPPDVQN